MSELTLSQTFDALAAAAGVLDGPVPAVVAGNLAGHIVLRPYQEEAIKRFVYYMDGYRKRQHPTQLLFHMATGSGKTVIMAALIAYLYEKGYRNFLFFVNSSTIIEKTKVNFLDPSSSKYLFAESIRIGDRTVRIREVSNFDEAVASDINIHFTTVQGLHGRINDPRENSVTIEDFESHEVVFISDEAHHMNAETKAAARKPLGAEEKKEKQSWEGTVNEIFRGNRDNVMLEFTATSDFQHPAIFEKYRDKVIYDYSLKQFREDGYSKDIEVRQADLPPRQRMLEAVLLSQYRRKIAEANGIHLKPVILMKSKQIAESAVNEEVFHDLVAKLSGDDLVTLREVATDPTLERVFDYLFDERGIAPDEMAAELRSDFGPEKVINVNQKQDLQHMQLLLNSLEDYANEVRVIFAVDKLNEGWDVLNLYDIVRLYDTRDGGANKVGKTTMAEAQLIGRGARYFPFAVNGGTEDAAMRKFDLNTDNPMRILEQLYYHCSHNPRYLDDIKRALRETGALANTERRTTVRVKESFRQSDFFRKQFIFTNRRRRRTNDDVRSLGSHVPSKVIEYPHLLTGQVTETSAFGERTVATSGETVGQTVMLSSFGLPILRFAVDANDFFTFDNLRRHFPHLTSIREFITDSEYLGNVRISLRGRQRYIDRMGWRQMLDIAHYALRQIESSVRASSTEYEGTRQFHPQPVSSVVVDRDIKISVQGERGLSWAESLVEGLNGIDLKSKDWHVYDDSYGTDQEKLFLRYIHDHADRLNAIYDEFYVIRNEKLFQIYAFEDGSAFEPDFVLFLKRKQNDATAVFQVFIEPKGGVYADKDRWKEDFLKEIADRSDVDVILQDTNFRILGLPFFNQEDLADSGFAGEFRTLLEEPAAAT